MDLNFLLCLTNHLFIFSDLCESKTSALLENDSVECLRDFPASLKVIENHNNHNMPTMHNNGQEEYIVNGKSERRTVEMTDFKGDLNMPTMYNKGQENVMTFDLHIVNVSKVFCFFLCQ